jgi:hypothetical protein
MGLCCAERGLGQGRAETPGRRLVQASGERICMGLGIRQRRWEWRAEDGFDKPLRRLREWPNV